MPLDMIEREKPLKLYHRPVLIDLGLLVELVLRDDQGRPLTIDWREPDENGVYEPTFTSVDDGKVLIDRSVLAELERRAGGRD